MGRGLLFSVLVSLTLAMSVCAFAQDNYEIQVYGSETVPKSATMVELHSNFTFQGEKQIVNGVIPTEHQLHETLEITHGFTDWFETGFYVFTSAKNGYGWDWVGDHIRPRVAIPESWKWPVGLSLSTEIGYQRPIYSPDTWTVELRPIIDKKIGPWYLSFNPSFDKSLHGFNQNQAWNFSPNVKVSYDFTRRVTGGLEYYGALGPVNGFDPISEEQQQIVPAIDLNLSPNWEFNFGVGVGVTHGTDHLLAKMIVGYRFDHLWFPRSHRGGPPAKNPFR